MKPIKKNLLLVLLLSCFFVQPLRAQIITSNAATDFAPGAIGSPSVSAISQMKSFPLPRFKTGHSAMVNIPVLGLRALGDAYEANADNSDSAKISRYLDIQKQICQKWNMTLSFNSDNLSDNPITLAQIQLGNQNPNFKRSVMTFWGHDGYDINSPLITNTPPPPYSTSAEIHTGTHPLYSALSGNCPGAFYVTNNSYSRQQYLSDNYYLRNADGRFLNIYNQNLPYNYNHCNVFKYRNPAAPVGIFAYDGQLQKTRLDRLANLLVPQAGSVNTKFSLIMENGEQLPIFTCGYQNGQQIPNSVADIDPLLSADFNQSCGGNRTGAAWRQYSGERFRLATQAYADVFKGDYEQQGTLFTHYALDGHPQWREAYTETRKISSFIKGKKYATPDFYPNSQNWRGWWGPWHGWEWIAACRQQEIALGDSLFSPFVTAGWSGNEAQNIRPGYWLGLMKTLGVAGADFYYISYFGGLPTQFSDTNPASNPANYIWQLSTPVYAQALSTHFADLVQNGYLLEGDRPNQQNNSAVSYSFKAYNVGSSTINDQVLVVARKHNLLPRYVITATIQPDTYYTSTPTSQLITTVIDGDTLVFEARSQGSTYIYDKSDVQKPVFYQLDAWHEGTHPSYWSKDFRFDAEIYDNIKGNLAIKTEKPANTTKNNFTQFTSYLSGSGSVDYTFEPRQTGKYYVSFLARSKSGLNTPITVTVGGVAKTVYVSGKEWSCYAMAGNNNDTLSFNSMALNETQLLSIVSTNSDFEIDAILVTQNKAQCPTNYSISCNKTFIYTQNGIDGGTGSTSYNASNDSYTLVGSGNDLTGSSDRFFYNSQNFEGDAEFTVKVNSMIYTDGGAKVGIMLRSDLAPDAPSMMVAVTPANLVGFHYRGIRSGGTTGNYTQRQNYNSANMSHWLRLKRTGKHFDAYWSTDNSNWILIDTAYIPDFSTNYLMGLAVSSNLDNPLGQTTANVQNFRIVQCPTQPTACLMPFDFIDAAIGTGFGSTSYDPASRIYTTTASGDALNDNQDAFNYGFVNLRGNTEFTMRVGTLSYTDGQSKVGIMLRSNLQEGSPNVFLGTTPLGQIYFQARNISGSTPGISATTPQASTTTNNWLKIRRVGNYFQAYWSTNNDNWLLIGAISINNFPQNFLAGIATTSNSTNTATASIDNLSIQNCQTTAGCEQPFNFVTQNVGGAAGSTANNSFNGTYSVAGSGSVSGLTDVFQYAFKSNYGDVEMAVKINSLTYTDGSAKAGIMIRAGLAANAANVYLAITPTNTLFFQNRSQQGTNTNEVLRPNIASFSPGNMAHWLKLKRVGDTFKSYWSADNVNWVAIDSATINNFPKNYLLGIAVAANQGNNTTRAIVTNLLIKKCVEAECSQPFGYYVSNIGSGVGTVNTGLANGYILTATSGGNMLNTADDFTFAARNIAQNAEIVAKINSITNSSTEAKVCVAMRTSLLPNAPMVYVGVTPTNQIYFAYRTSNGDTITSFNIQKGNAPSTNMAHWIKLRRINNVFEAYWSADNSTWEGLGSVALNSFAQNYLVGIGITNNNASSCTAVLDNLSINKCLDGNANQPIFGSDVNAGTSYANPFDLSNYPNPFKQTTTISFKIPQKNDVTLCITDIYGKQIALLLKDKLTEGFYEIPYNSASLPSGTYIATLQVGSQVAYKRMVLFK